MNEISANLLTKMEALKQKYLVQLETKIEALKIFSNLCTSGMPSMEQIEKMADLAHKLSGSGATYGFGTISNTAQSFEDDLLNRPLPSHEALARKARLLIEACENAHGSMPLQAPHESKLALEEGAQDDSSPIILLVDDDESIRQIITQLFQGDARVIVARNGQEGLSILEKTTPAVILLDDKMPGLSGMAFLEQLQKQQESRKIAVMMLSANRKNSDVLMAYKFGVVDYVNKPFDPEPLRNRVMEYITNNQRTLLIADDDPTIRNILNVKFKALGFRVILTGTMEETFAQVVSQKPNLIILDRMIPGGDGLTLFQKLKKTPGAENIPTLFLTGKRRETEIIEAIKLGAKDYIVKPFRLEDVVARVMRLLYPQQSA